MKKNNFKVLVLLLILPIIFMMSGCEQMRTDRLEKTYELVLEDINCEKVEQDLNFPTSFNGVDIAWESSRPDIIGNDGKLSKPAKESVVSVQMTMTYGLSTKTETLTFIVSGIE